MRSKTLYLAIGALALVVALFSCGVEHEPPAAETPATETLAEPPLRRSTLIGRNTEPVLQEESGPQGPFTEFQNLTAETLDKLPRVEDMRKRRDFDPHLSPPELFEASPSLGKIATALRESPELVPQGIDFYSECAKREGTLTAIRILCLRNLRYWAEQQPDVLEVDPADYPADLWRIAESLPPVVR